MKDLLNKITQSYKENGLNDLSGAPEEKKFLYLYASFHYYFGDEDYYYDVRDHVNYTLENNNFAQAVFEEETFDDKVIDVLVPYYLSEGEVFEKRVAKYRVNTVAQMLDNISSGIYDLAANKHIINEYWDKNADGDTKIVIRLITNYNPDYDERMAIKDEFDNAVKEVSKTVPIDYSNPTFVKALSEKLHEKGLDSLLSGDSLDPNMLGHFLVVSAYTTDKVNINTNSRYIEKVKNPDKSLEERLIKGLSTNKDKNDYELDIDDKWGLFELTYDDVYRGSVFIPLNNDPVSAQTGWGNDNIKLDEARDLAEQYQNYQKSLTQKDSSSRNLYERE